MKSLPLLDELESPTELRRFSDEQLDQLAEDIRHRIKEAVSQGGGHLASNLGTVELTIALHRIFDFSSDRLLWDVGHQAYPHKLLTGRALQFDTNRQQGGLSGFPDPKESSFDVAKVGHSSTAISTGVGLAEAERQSGGHRRTVVVVGDGALTGGMSFEGLINAGDLKAPLLVILNDNGNFIDPPVGALHHYLDRVRSGRLYNKMRDRFVKLVRRLGVDRIAESADQAVHKLIAPGFIFEDLGFRYFGPIDGHDRREMERLIGQVQHIPKPVLVHVHTKKGGGWKPAEGDPLTYHAGKNFDIETGSFKKTAPGRPTYSTVLAEVLLELAEEDPLIAAVTAAMPTGTGLRTFGQVHPDKMYDVGICEQHSFGFVQGLALGGRRPFLCHYSTFAQRGFDQLFQELVVQRDLGVILTLDRAGLVGEDGETHQGLYDIAWSRVLPGTVLMAPKDGPELKAMIRWAHQERLDVPRAAAYVIRYPKEEIPDLTWGQERPVPIAAGKAEVLCQGKDIMIWAYGVMCSRAWDVVERLRADGLQPTLVNARFVKPFDDALLKQLSADHKHVISIEDHALPGGFGSAVAESIQDQQLALQLTRFGVDDTLIGHAKRSEQLVEQGLDVESLYAAIRAQVGLSDDKDDDDLAQVIPHPHTG